MVPEARPGSGLATTRIHPRGGGAPFEKLELAFRNEPPKPRTTSILQGSGVINSSAAGSTYRVFSSNRQSACEDRENQPRTFQITLDDY